MNIFVLLCLLGSAKADVSFEVNGRKYEKVSVAKLEEKSGYVLLNHSYGVKRFSLGELPKNIQKELGINIGFKTEEEWSNERKNRAREKVVALQLKKEIDKAYKYKLWVLTDVEGGYICGGYDYKNITPARSSLGRSGGGGGNAPITFSREKNFDLIYIDDPKNILRMKLNQSFEIKLKNVGRYVPAVKLPKKLPSIPKFEILQYPLPEK